jgi:GABA(A) receptor-associated protein
MIALIKKKYIRNENNKVLKSMFQEKHGYDKRLNESTIITEKYPGRVPIVCERICKNVPELNRTKYLCPMDMSFANFMYVIRRRMKLEPEKALYLFVNDKMIPCSKVLGEIYEKEKNADGFLYIRYGGETTFG